MEVLPDLPNEGCTSPPPPPHPCTPSLLAGPISPFQRPIELSDVLCLLLVRLLPLEHVLHEDRVFPTAWTVLGTEKALIRLWGTQE